MRNYPATLLQVLENKLEAGADPSEPIPFDRTDLEQATDELEIDVREVTEIASAYSGTRSLPDEFIEHGYDSIEQDPDAEGDGYRFVPA